MRADSLCFVLLWTCIIVIAYGCEKTNEYRRQYGKCQINIETCLTAHLLTYRWNAFAQFSGGCDPCEWAKTDDFIWDSENGAIEHVLQKLMNISKSCNCDTFEMINKDQCELQVRSCFNFDKDPEDVTNDKRQYETWAMPMGNMTNISINGYYCCAYNESISIQNAIDNLSTKHKCASNIRSNNSSNNPSTPEIATTASHGYQPTITTNYIVIILSIASCVTIIVFLGWRSHKTKDNGQYQEELQERLNAPEVNVQISMLCDIKQKADKLLDTIHNNYQTIKDDPHIDPQFLQNALNVYLEILTCLEELSPEQYKTFMCETGATCNQLQCVPLENMFKSASIEEMARCQMLAKIHLFFKRSKSIISKERCGRYRLVPNKSAVTSKTFDFSRKFVYQSDNEEKESNLIFPPLKWKNLDEELLNNNKAQLAREQLTNQRHKAACYCKSHRIIKLLQTHSKQELKDLENCILALMIYSDFEVFQREYSKTYQQEWQKDHNHFFHFAKILKRSVLEFGTTVKEGRIKQFFHGVSEVLVPSEIVGQLCEGISIYCPLSTSSCFAVATRFAGDGIIMTLGGSTSDAKYFPVFWLSRYPYEHEYIFLQNEAKMELLNIHLSTGDQFHVIIEALKTLDAILHQSDYHFHDANAGEIINYIASLLEDKHYEFDHKYAEQLIIVHLQKKRHLTINYLVLQKIYNDLFQLFCKEEWIVMENVMKVFPNIQDITIKGINLSKFVMQDIYDKHPSIFDPNMNDSCTWTLNKMTIYANKNSSPLKAAEAVSKYKSKVQKTIQLNISQERNLDGTPHDILVIEPQKQNM